MGLIILLVLLGVFFLVVELVLLPGVTVGTILSLVSYAVAVYMAFERFGLTGGAVTLAVVVVISLVAVVLSLRAKTWRRFSLRQKIESSSMETPSDTVSVGQCGIAVSRLSPMGKVNIDGRVYEAKSIDSYIDQRSRVEVTGFENFTVVVKRAEDK
ncbi:MAG: NfeD family protein [Alistipes sp.]|nr:NfeD family protein [Alistipes sp.]